MAIGEVCGQQFCQTECYFATPSPQEEEKVIEPGVSDFQVMQACDWSASEEGGKWCLDGWMGGWVHHTASSSQIIKIWHSVSLSLQIYPNPGKRSPIIVVDSVWTLKRHPEIVQRKNYFDLWLSVICFLHLRIVWLLLFCLEYCCTVIQYRRVVSSRLLPCLALPFATTTHVWRPTNDQTPPYLNTTDFRKVQNV